MASAARSEDASIPSLGTGALRMEPAADAKLASETAGRRPLLPWPNAGGSSPPAAPAMAGPVSGVAGLEGALGAGRGAGAVRGEGEGGGGAGTSAGLALRRMLKEEPPA